LITNGKYAGHFATTTKAAFSYNECFLVTLKDNSNNTFADFDAGLNITLRDCMLLPPFEELQKNSIGVFLKCHGFGRFSLF